MEFRARRQIDAAPKAVWKALLDVGAWPSWDSGVTKVEGTARDGGKITVHSGERFSGPLVGPMGKRMPDLQPSFELFADGLKARCERSRR